MKRWLLVITIGTVALALGAWELYKAGEGRRLVTRFANEPGLAPRVVAMGPDAVPLLCEAMDQVPARGMSEVERRRALSYINALDALAAGYPYTMGQSVPFLIDTIRRMETDETRDLILDAVARAFGRSGVTAVIDALEFEWRQSKADDAAFLAYEATAAAVLRKMGPDGCLPTLEARLLMTPGDFRKNLVTLAAGFAPNERVDRILARALETEDDAARRAWLAETIDRLRKEGKLTQAAPRETP